MKKIVTLSLIAVSGMFFSACTSSSGINMDNQTPGFQKGAKDGCETAKGMYTKDHTAFNKDQQYNEGWFYGRKKCNPADSKH